MQFIHQNLNFFVSQPTHRKFFGTSSNHYLPELILFASQPTDRKFFGHHQIMQFIHQNLIFLLHSRLIEIFLGHQIIICQNLYFLLHSRLIEKFWDIIKSCSLFAGTFCFIADYTIDFFGYDLCIIAIIFPLEPEKFFLTSLIHVIYIFNIDFFLEAMIYT